MSEKRVGYGLMIVGLVVMVYALWNVISTFTNSASQPSYITIPEASLSLPGIKENEAAQKNPTQADLEQLQNLMNQQMSGLFSPEAMNQTINLSIHFLLMTFVAGIGYKFASLGTQLVRPIVIKSKESKSQNETQPQTVQPQ